MRTDKTPITGSMRRNAFGVLSLILLVWAAVTFLQAPKLTAWDFGAFWEAGGALNRGLDPYTTGAVHFYSPIFVAVFFQPFTALPLMTAKLLWSGLTVLGGATLALVLLNHSKIPVTLKAFMIALAVLLAFEPFSAVEYLGQTDILVVLSLALSWLLLDKRRPFLAGLVFCAGATNPHLITGVGLYYLYRSIVRKQYTLLLGMALGAVPLVACCIYYSRSFVEWITIVLPAAQKMATGDLIQVTLLQLITSLLGKYVAFGPLDVAAQALVGIVSLFACGLAIRIWHKSRGASSELDMAIAAILTLITATFAYHQDYVVLVLAAPSLVHMWRERIPVDKVAFLFVCLSTFLFSALVGLVTNGAGEHRLLFYYVAPLLAGALALTQLRVPEPVAQRLFPWVAVLLSFSVCGSFLSQFLGVQVALCETGVIMLGLFAYLRGVWLWHPALRRAGSEQARSLALAIAPDRSAS